MKSKYGLHSTLTFLFAVVFTVMCKTASAEAPYYAALGYGTNPYYASDQYGTTTPVFSCDAPFYISIFQYNVVAGYTTFSDLGTMFDGTPCNGTGNWTVTLTTTAGTHTLYVGCPGGSTIPVTNPASYGEYGPATITVVYNGSFVYNFAIINIDIIPPSLTAANIVLSSCSTSLCSTVDMCPCTGNFCLYALDATTLTPITDPTLLSLLTIDYGGGNTCTGCGFPICPIDINNVGPMGVSWGGIGSYTAKLSLSQGDCASSGTSNVTVNVNIPSAYTINQNCGVVTFTPTYTSCNASSGYTWDFGDGSPISHTVSPTHTFTAPGSYNTSLTVPNACGGTITTSLWVYITVTGPPTLTTSSTAATCPTNHNGTASVSEAIATPYLWHWSTGGTGPTITGLTPNTYTVTVSYDGGTCNASATATVTVTGGNCGCDSLNAQIVANPDSVCVGDSLRLFLNGGPYGEVLLNGVNVTGIINIPPTGIAQTDYINSSHLGINTACLVVFSAYPNPTDIYCSDTACITFFTGYCGCNVQGQITASTDTPCVGDSIFLTFSGAPYGQLTDNGQVVLPLFPIPPAGLTHGFFVDGGSVGLNHVCLTTYSFDPDFCQSFDDSVRTSAAEVASDVSNGIYKYRNTWLSNWQVTDGTPSLEHNGTITGINAFDGSQYALLGYCPNGDGCEGMELQYNFVAGQSYTISLADRRVNAYSISANYYLLNAPLAHTYNPADGCSNDHCGTVPAGSQFVYTSTPANAWGVTSFSFTATSNYQYLWISVTSAAAIPTGESADYAFDSLCIHGKPCTDTTCLDVWVKNCNSCAAYNGQAVLKMTHLAGTTYQFQDIGAIEPNYINWLVDGNAAGQTTGYGAFNYSFNVAGEHTICMQAVFIFTDSLGNNICCYQTACDSIDVDSCDFWKATAQITYQLDPNNYHNVTFYYAGNPNNLTIVWNFGDGTSGVSDGSPITHYYADSTWNICAELIWSLGDSAVSHVDSGGVCCCVDTICESVVVTPCNAVNFQIVQSTDAAGNAVYQVVPVSPGDPSTAASSASSAANATTTAQAGTTVAGGAIAGATAAQSASAFAGLPSGLNFTGITWTVNGTTVQTGIGQIYGSSDPGNVGDIICATVNYTIVFDDGEKDSCSTVVCDTVSNNKTIAPKGGLLKYFPNPANEILTLVLNATSAQSTGTIELLDNLGSPLLTKSLDNMIPGMQQTFIDLGKVAPGLYMMRVTIDHHAETVKVIKE